jgi:putative transposase
MINHVHLQMTPAERRSVSATLQALGHRFVPNISYSYRRTGTLWEGRFEASPVQEKDYLLTCYRYIELNPVRAGMVESPADDFWWSCRANALGKNSPLLHPHPLYLALGAYGAARWGTYQAHFATEIIPRSSRPCAHVCRLPHTQAAIDSAPRSSKRSDSRSAAPAGADRGRQLLPTKTKRRISSP